MNKTYISKKKLKAMIAPKVGDIITTNNGNTGKIIYVNNSHMRITCTGNAQMNDEFEINGINYSVNRVSENRFNAEPIIIKKIDNPFAKTAKLI